MFLLLLDFIFASVTCGFAVSILDTVIVPTVSFPASSCVYIVYVSFVVTTNVPVAVCPATNPVRLFPSVPFAKSDRFLFPDRYFAIIALDIVPLMFAVTVTFVAVVVGFFDNDIVGSALSILFISIWLMFSFPALSLAYIVIHVLSVIVILSPVSRLVPIVPPPKYAASFCPSAYFLMPLPVIPDAASVMSTVSSTFVFCQLLAFPVMFITGPVLSSMIVLLYVVSFPTAFLYFTYIVFVPSPSGSVYAFVVA